MRQLVTVVFLSSLLACGGSPRLSRSAGGLEVQAAGLELPDAFVGYPTHAGLELRNTSRGARTARVEVSPPFAVASGVLEVGGGAAVLLEVRFEPGAEGPSAGALRLTVDGEAVEVALSGFARAAPDCRAPGPCRAASFDPGTGACVEVGLPDQSPCDVGDLCLEEGRCVGGACLGTARACDDGNRCTTDACEPSKGCLHLDASASCPASADPCRVPFCDPVSGCGAAFAQDGTACGPANCDTARVCLSGSCRISPVPEGATCAAASPCQGEGTCRAHLCQQPEPTPLIPAWSYPVPVGRTLYFNGLADSGGNLYWAECSAALGCDLVSATSGGFVRYRVTLGAPARTYVSSVERGLLVLSGDRVISALSERFVEARRASDGAEVWRLDLLGELAGAQPGATITRVTTGPLVDDGSGGLYVGGTVALDPGAGKPRLQGATLVALGVSGGAVRWKRVVPNGNLRSLAADEAGNGYAAGFFPSDAGVTSGLLSFAPGGAERWRTQANYYGSNLAVSAGRLAISGGGELLRSTADGGVVSPAGTGYYDSWGSEPLLGADAGFLFTHGCDYCCVDLFIDQPRLRSFSLLDAASLWELGLSMKRRVGGMGSASDPALAANGDVLFALSQAPYYYQADAGAQLQAVTSAGQERFSCDLPAPAPFDAVDYSGATALLPGRLVMTAQGQCYACETQPPPSLVAFDLPGYDLGATGWVTPGGSNLRSGRPR
ncbi:MAG: PQQ-binding-like beta-propeller repeat protein [Myxococcaceae bacterium]